MNTKGESRTSSRIRETAAAVKFAVHPRPGAFFSNTPTVLILTQNIGAIDACKGIEASADGVDPITPACANPTSALSATALTTATTTMGFTIAQMQQQRQSSPLPAECTNSDGGSDGVPAAVREELNDFIAHVRCWLHRVAVLTAARGCAGEVPAKGDDASASQTSSGDVVVAGGYGAAHSYQTCNGPHMNHDTETAGEYSAQKSVPALIDVFVLQLQEIGGKHMHRCFNDYLGNILATSLLPEAGWTSGLLMDNNGNRETFTAMGTIVFLSPRVCATTSLLSFPHRTYIPVLDDPCSYSGSVSNVFHAAKFSGAGKSRKGFLLVSLRLGATVLNVCNMHLFNDDDNALALAASPSAYAVRRVESFLEAVCECLSVVSRDEAFFIGGDCNTRLDGHTIARLAKEIHGIEVHPEKKNLRTPDLFWTRFFSSEEAVMELHSKFDREPQHLMDACATQLKMELAEMPVRFAPTYSRIARGPGAFPIYASSFALPLSPSEKRKPEQQQLRVVTGVGEDEHRDGVAAVVVRDHWGYARTRVPAWCDRIFFNPAALAAMSGVAFGRGASSAPASPVGGSMSSAKDEVMARKQYLYDAVSFVNTDHDGVFLLF